LCDYFLHQTRIFYTWHLSRNFENFLERYHVEAGGTKKLLDAAASKILSFSSYQHFVIQHTSGSHHTCMTCSAIFEET
jgi:hypothetical protein